MPLGRKHFRRSRDAPICYGKGLLASPVVKDHCLKRPVSTLAEGGDSSKRLDDGEHIVDSEGKAAKPFSPDSHGP